MALPWAYFDTSVLAKRYLNEPGSFQARLLMREYRCLTSALAPVEAVSALARRRVTGELSDRALAAIESRLTIDRGRWDLVAVSETLLRRAEQVVHDRGIKALDGIHIAGALLFQTNSMVRVPFVSADERQLNAAAACGLSIKPVHGSAGPRGPV